MRTRAKQKHVASESLCLHELILSENARVWYYRETGKLKNIFRGGAL